MVTTIFPFVIVTSKPGWGVTAEHILDDMSQIDVAAAIKQHLFCKSRFSEVGHLASMFR